MADPTLPRDADGMVTLYALDTGAALKRHSVDAREMIALDPPVYSLSPVAPVVTEDEAPAAPKSTRSKR